MLAQRLSLGIFVTLVLFQISLTAKLRDRNTKDYRLVCYYGAWSNWRTGDGKTVPDDIDPELCTHLVYGFAVMKENKITAHDPYMDLEEEWGLGHYKKFVNLRKKNPGLTTLIAIGGWNEGNVEEELKYSKMAADPEKRKIFVNSVLEFLKRHDFDGLDFDWEYPVLRDGIYVPEDKVNFVQVLKELHEAFKPHGYLLTCAVAAGKHTLEAGYDIPQVSKYLDIINVMAYDFHGTWENYTGHNSPLYARPEESENDKHFNVDYAINYWIKEGADKSKMTLGMPLYGRCYTLTDRTETGYGAPSSGNGTEGIFTKLPGMQGFHEMCLLNKTEKDWNIVWNEYHGAPYIYKGDQWCSLDDPDSIRLKVQYLKAKGLSGGMTWSVDTDDFRGSCFGTKFILTKTIVEELKKKSIAPIPVPPISRPDNPWLIDQDKIETPKPNLCKAEGVIPSPDDCKSFIQCTKNGDEFTAYEVRCQLDLVYNDKYKFCDYPGNVPDCVPKSK